MIYLSFIAVALAAFWILLSGLWDNGLLWALGALSLILVMYLAYRIECRYPFKQFGAINLGLPKYWLWLIGQIIKSNLAVVKQIWLPTKYPIDPAMEPVAMSQKSRLAKTIYANSITLTPGTVSVKIQANSKLLVHALHRSSLTELHEGEMDQKVTALEKTA